MSTSSNSRTTGIAIAAFLLVGAIIWVFAIFQGSSPLPAPSAPEATPAQTKAAPTPRPAPAPAPAAAPVTAQPTATSDGAEEISAILADESLDFPTSVNRLLALLPSLNEDGRIEAANHIANLSDDEKAAEWSKTLIANRLPKDAAEVLFNDLLNRPHDLTMPTLSAIADVANHPLKAESIEILEVLYEQPPQGTTWTAWIDLKRKEEAQ